MAGRVAQVIKHLPSKHEVLSSNSSTPPPKKKKGKVGCLWWLRPVILTTQEAEIRRMKV
jgi:hypothetical protein